MMGSNQSHEIETEVCSKPANRFYYPNSNAVENKNSTDAKNSIDVGNLNTNGNKILFALKNLKNYVSVNKCNNTQNTSKNNFDFEKEDQLERRKRIMAGDRRNCYIVKLGNLRKAQLEREKKENFQRFIHQKKENSHNLLNNVKSINDENKKYCEKLNSSYIENNQQSNNKTCLKNKQVSVSINKTSEYNKMISNVKPDEKNDKFKKSDSISESKQVESGNCKSCPSVQTNNVKTTEEIICNKNSDKLINDKRMSEPKTVNPENSNYKNCQKISKQIIINDQPNERVDKNISDELFESQNVPDNIKSCPLICTNYLKSLWGNVKETKRCVSSPNQLKIKDNSTLLNCDLNEEEYLNYSTSGKEIFETNNCENKLFPIINYQSPEELCAIKPSGSIKVKKLSNNKSSSKLTEGKSYDLSKTNNYSSSGLKQSTEENSDQINLTEKKSRKTDFDILTQNIGFFDINASRSPIKCFDRMATSSFGTKDDYTSIITFESDYSFDEFESDFLSDYETSTDKLKTEGVPTLNQSYSKSSISTSPSYNNIKNRFEKNVMERSELKYYNKLTGNDYYKELAELGLGRWKDGFFSS